MTQIKSNIPKIRFKDFSQEWEEKRLGEILIIGSGRDYKHLEKGKYPVYGTGGYMLSVSDYLYDGDSVCIGRKGTIDKPRYLTGKFWTVDTLFYTHSFQNTLPKYIFYIFNTINWKKYNEASGVPSLSKNTLNKIDLYFPQLPEQQKIASFLSLVDEKIEKIKDKKKSLEEYKRGVMQKIFSRENRFKDENGGEFGEWEEKKLGEISINYYQGINTTADEIKYFKEGYPIIQAKHITKEVLDFDDVKYLGKGDFNKYKNKYKPLIDDILMTNIGTLGKIVLVGKENNFLIAWNIFKVSLNLNICNSKFILYNLKLIAKNGYFERMKTGNATKFVNKGDMLSINISLPSLPEQQKIAEFLSGIDEKIDSIEGELEKIEEFKKGLLQGMFV